GYVALVTAALLTAAFILMTNEAKARAVDAEETNMKVAWAILGGYGQGFSVQGDKLLAGNTVLNANNGPVDRIKELVDGTASVFLGDVRVATNVIKADGTRAVGTRLARGPVYDAVLRDGKPYRGQADVLGKRYFVAYDPIKDASGAVIGVLYTGILESEFLASINHALLVLIGL